MPLFVLLLCLVQWARGYPFITFLERCVLPLQKYTANTYDWPVAGVVVESNLPLDNPGVCDGE